MMNLWKGDQTISTVASETEPLSRGMSPNNSTSYRTLIFKHWNGVSSIYRWHCAANCALPLFTLSYTHTITRNPLKLNIYKHDFKLKTTKIIIEW